MIIEATSSCPSVGQSMVLAHMSQIALPWPKTSLAAGRRNSETNHQSVKLKTSLTWQTLISVISADVHKTCGTLKIFAVPSSDAVTTLVPSGEKPAP